MSYSAYVERSSADDAEPGPTTASSGRVPNPPYRFAPRNEHERIQLAVATTIAAKGYKASSVRDICAAGELSPKTFHEHFRNKREAMIDTLEAGADLRMTYCREAFETADTWPEAIWEALEAHTGWMAENPAFARLGLVEIFALGATGDTLLRSLLDAFAIFLAPGYRLAPADAFAVRIVDETVANDVFGLMSRHVARESAETLPTLVPALARAVLVPFLGSEQADAFIASRQRRAD